MYADVASQYELNRHAGPAKSPSEAYRAATADDVITHIGKRPTRWSHKSRWGKCRTALWTNHAPLGNCVNSCYAVRKSRWGRLNRLRARISDQPAWPEEFFSQLEAPGIIQREYGNGGPAGCR